MDTPSAEQTLHLPDTNAVTPITEPYVFHPDWSHLEKMAVMYMIAGLAIGFAEYTVAKSILRNSPRHKELFNAKRFMICLGVNALAWPGVFVWLILLGLMKGAMIYLGRGTKSPR